MKAFQCHHYAEEDHGTHAISMSRIGRRSESGAPGQPVRDGDGDGGGAVRPEPVEAAAQAAGPTRTVTRDLSDSDRSPASHAVTSTDLAHVLSSLAKLSVGIETLAT
jgi:hypothetical protein